MSDAYFGRGTTPERVTEAIERAKDERDRSKGAVTRAKVDAFFGKLAEERKRAEAG